MDAFPLVIFSSFFLFKDNFLQWVIQVFALVSKILCVHACAFTHVRAWTGKFHFQFCCVYPADSLQSVDKKGSHSMEGKCGKIAKKGWKENLNWWLPVQQFFIGRHIFRGRMVYCCAVNKCVLWPRFYLLSKHQFNQNIIETAVIYKCCFLVYWISQLFYIQACVISHLLQ